VKALETKLSASERSRREQSRELDAALAQIDELKAEVEMLQKDSDGRMSDATRSLEMLASDNKKRVEELEAQREMEERHKHELAINLRSVEDRARADLEQLEVQKSQLELQLGALQVQLQEEQQKCVDLSVSLGEAQHRQVQLEERGNVEAVGDEARRAAEAEARELQDRLRIAEEKLLDAQTMREMFGKETEMYRSELKVARDERTRLEEELTRSQEKLREASTAKGQPGAQGQEAVMEAMQKDFEGRMERFRDEVQYLRQKCDEKEKRCEQLLAEKSSLMVELKSSASAAAGRWQATEVISSSAEDLEAGNPSKAGAGKAAGRSLVRSLPLAAPGWLRSSDEPLRMVVRTLATVPEARLVFFAYVILIHAWVLFILQHMAMTHHEDHDS